MKLYETLEQQLKKEPNFVTDNGELKKWVVLNKAQNFDEELIGLLLDNADLKDKFFVNVKGTLVFNQNLFVQFLEQKNYLNDSYTQYKNKVGLTIDGKYLKQRNEVALVWPFKDCILEGGQSREEDKREEIFFNEILAQDEITQLLEPKVLTNAKRIDKDGEKPLDQFNRNENGTITDNLIIKGNNLLALHTLKEEFAGKVKLIYIDPPYNTGGSGDTFAYNNSFKQSSWLTFMYNRLRTAKELLTQDGIICVTIDDFELPRLWLLLEDVFKKENHLGTVVIRNNPKGRMTTRKFSLVHEYAIFYGKSESAFIKKLPVKVEEKSHNYIKDENGNWYLPVNLRKQGVDSNAVNKKGKLSDRYFPIYFDPKTNRISVTEKLEIEILPIDGNGIKRIWRRGKDDIEKMFAEKELYAKETNNGFQLYFKFRGGLDGQLAQSIWFDSKFSASEYGTRILDELLGERELFSYPKSPEAIKQTILATLGNENGIILDFFGGSGTTAHAVLELNKEDGGNRQFILVEQMDYVESVTCKRVQKVIEKDNLQANFVYLELKKYNQTFIEQIEEAKDTETLLHIWEQMKAKSFFKYSVDLQKFQESLEEFKQWELKKQKEILCELLDKNQLYVNISSLNDADFACTQEEKRVTKDFYQIKK